MLLWATEKAVAGHISPAGRYLPTPSLSGSCLPASIAKCGRARCVVCRISEHGNLIVRAKEKNQIKQPAPVVKLSVDRKKVADLIALTLFWERKLRKPVRYQSTCIHFARKTVVTASAVSAQLWPPQNASNGSPNGDL